MYDYMTALQKRFCREVNYREIEKKVDTLRKDLAPKLSGDEWERILALVDEQDLLREQSNLDNFIAGFRLGVQLMAECLTGGEDD